MSRKQGYTLLELTVATALIGCAFVMCLPLLNSAMDSNTQNSIRFDKFQALDRLSQKLQEDIRSSCAVYLRQDGGFMLEIPTDSQPKYVAYNIYENEPEMLYRSEFGADKKCISTRIASHVRQYKVTRKENLPLLTIEISLAPEPRSLKPPLRYTIEACMRASRKNL